MYDFMYHFPVLAIMVLFLGAFIASLVGRRNAVIRNAVVLIAMVTSLVLILSLVKPILLEGQTITYWLSNWEPVGDWAIGISLEVDALSLFFALIVVVAVFVSGVYSFFYMDRDDSLVNYYTLFSMLSGSVLGLVLSGDLFNMFVMIEIMTFTAVALTAFRNTYEGALEGAFKYLVVGSLGSTSVLIGIALIYSQMHTLNLAQLAAMLPGYDSPVTIIAFAFLFVGFGSKAFLFPFHPLAADAHAVAPASISLMISGVLTKCGVYGIIRLAYTVYQNVDVNVMNALKSVCNPMNANFVQYFITGVGVVTMFICVTMAFNQHNFKRLLAFHSISQVGYVITVIGLGSALGLSAGLFHAMNHTIFKGLLFLTAGAVQHATGSLDLDELGGLSKKMPGTCALFLIGAASISGLPPFNGFASKWMIYQAAFQKAGETGNFFFVVVCVAALITSVLTLASFIKVAQSVFFGQLNPKFAKTREVSLGMRIPMWILAILCVVTGLFPDKVQQWLLAPATSAAMNAAGYIDAAMGQGYAASFSIPSFQPQSIFLSGAWQPVMWLLLLVSVTLAVCIVALLGSDDKAPAISETNTDTPADPKYESFFSGEASVYSQVGGSDLFWGFKHNWRHYFSFMHNWHSGVVNDYTLYGAAAIAVALVLCVIFL